MIDSKSLLNRFLSLVKIPSPSGHEDAVAQTVMSMLDELGIESERDETGSVFARVHGVGEPVFLTAHLDTVTPADSISPVVRDGVVYSDGTSVLGADDKSGVAIILEVLAVLKDTPHRPTEVLFTVEEETGLTGALGFDCTRLSAKLGIGLDAHGPQGNIIVSAPGQNSLAATVHGKASHAGVAPEDGINAIRIAAEAIAAMPLGRIDDETTSNIGLIQGGKATNIVPDCVEMRGEARSRDAAKLTAQTQAMMDAFKRAADNGGATVDIEVSEAYRAYVLDGGTPVVQLVSQAMESVGVTPNLVASGGGSDANIFCAAGIDTVQLSTGMADFHTCQEHIKVADMVQAATIVETCLKA